MILKYNNLKTISGDASYRIFFRKFDKEKKKSSIVIFSKKEKKKNLLIYSAINNLINKNNLLAPKLISQNYKNNFIEVSDFGDLTFHKILNTKKMWLIFIMIFFLCQKIKILGQAGMQF